MGEKLTADSKACDELEELMERELETQERILITLEESRVATEAVGGYVSHVSTVF